VDLSTGDFLDDVGSLLDYLRGQHQVDESDELWWPSGAGFAAPATSPAREFIYRRGPSFQMFGWLLAGRSRSADTQPWWTRLRPLKLSSSQITHADQGVSVWCQSRIVIR
jgi:hypothetical protein